LRKTTTTTVGGEKAAADFFARRFAIMRPNGWIILSALLVLSPAPRSAQADWFKEFVERCKTDWHRNNCWPEPFVYADRAHIRGPLDAMVANGWRDQNHLGTHHFSADSATLTTSGQLKIQEILSVSPPRFRTIYVQRASSRDATAARLDAVEQYASSMLPEGGLADVRESELIAEGRPAMVVDAINVRFHETQPVPQLPKSTGDSF
jgi:hypothetical protein